MQELIVRAILCGASLVFGFAAGWLWLRWRTIRDVQKLTADFTALHAKADQLANVLARVSDEEVSRAWGEIIQAEGGEMLQGYLDERGEG